MSVTFYGKWSLKVIAKNADFGERVRIAGSAASDGIVAGIAGQSVAAIDGSAWQADMQWSSDGANWFPSRIRRIPTVTTAEGLIVTLFADDNTPEIGDGDFNDLIVQFTYLNRDVNPSAPAAPPYSFTVPPGSVRPQRPPHEPGHCNCVCTCCRGTRTKRGCSC